MEWSETHRHVLSRTCSRLSGLSTTTAPWKSSKTFPQSSSVILLRLLLILTDFFFAVWHISTPYVFSGSALLNAWPFTHFAPVLLRPVVLMKGFFFLVKFVIDLITGASRVQKNGDAHPNWTHDIAIRLRKTTASSCPTFLDNSRNILPRNNYRCSWLRRTFEVYFSK